MSGAAQSAAHHTWTDGIVRQFLNSNLSLVLIILASVLGLAALAITPREEDPQIVVPLADVYVSFPGHSAREVEQLVATPLERLLYQIDGVEYVYSMSKPDQAIITVRYYVGQDRERSLVKLYKRIDESLEIVPPGVTGWVVKPVEIDDVPVVTLTLTGKDAGNGDRGTGNGELAAGNRERGTAASGAPAAGTETEREALASASTHGALPRAAAASASSSGGPDDHTLRRVAEEMVSRLATVPKVSRAYIVGGRPRMVYVYLDPQRLQAYSLAPLQVQRALTAANVTMTVGEFTRDDKLERVEVGRAFADRESLSQLVVGVFDERPVTLLQVADIEDGPAEATTYVRHGWGPARDFGYEHGFPGTVLGNGEARRANSEREYKGGVDASIGEDTSHAIRNSPFAIRNSLFSQPAVTLAIAKQKGSNAVWVAEDVLKAASELERTMVPDDVSVIVTRNYGLTADEKVNELVEALAVAVFIVIALLTVSLGWREAFVVAVAIPVVFGLTLAVNYLFGYTINRVTLFALILALGLLVDDPIVDVENIARHFGLRRRATRQDVLEAVAEIRPPLITATLAVIVSFLPMFFITGMMGPYMRPMALNVPVTMLMSMVVAFTITPWLAYHVLRRRYTQGASAGHGAHGHDETDVDTLKHSPLYKLFYPLMAPLLHSRRNAWLFLGGMGVLLLATAGLAAIRAVPLKMLPFDNKNELLFVLDLPEGTTLERSDAAVRDFEQYLAQVPEVVDFTSYVGVASPMDFNGLVRHYYLRRGDNVAEVRVDLATKKARWQQSHAIGLRLRDDLTAIAQRHDAVLKVVEVPPGPPVISTLVAEVYGQPDNSYDDLIAASQTVRARLAREPRVVDLDDSVEAAWTKLTFVVDKEKAALNGVSVAEIAETVQIALAGSATGTLRQPNERQPLVIELRVPRALRSSAADLEQLQVVSPRGMLVSLAELGHWETGTVETTIYHKNLEPVVYVFAETAGRTPAECVVDVIADQAKTRDGYTGSWVYADAAAPQTKPVGSGWLEAGDPRPLSARNYVFNGGGLRWWVPSDIRVAFAGEGEWQITLDVFRDLGLAFAAALVGIYILLVAQMGSFILPVIVMLAIPLTIIGIMPGFWFLNLFAADVGQYADPVLFTATGMIGMIALAGIVTRDSIILVDFIHLSLRRGRSLFDAIMESRVVRLRPILLTTGAAMLGAAPITIDPIFSGLAWALIFGLFASTVFTLFVIPVVYWLLYANTPGHGLPQLGE